MGRRARAEPSGKNERASWHGSSLTSFAGSSSPFGCSAPLFVSWLEIEKPAALRRNRKSRVLFGQDEKSPRAKEVFSGLNNGTISLRHHDPNEIMMTETGTESGSPTYRGLARLDVSKTRRHEGGIDQRVASALSIHVLIPLLEFLLLESN